MYQYQYEVFVLCAVCAMCCDVLQEMMMEIMDKYVQAGEALAEKENDVRHLTNCLLYTSPSPRD